MNTDQIRSFVMSYLEAEKCSILEKHPAYVTVKLSPAADQDITNRPYYWSFVERTGTEPETMTYTFIFDPQAYRQLQQEQNSLKPAAPASGTPSQGDSILSRYFGFVPTTVSTRIPQDELTFGSRRLEQIFDAVRKKGRFVRLFEAYTPPSPRHILAQPYETWYVVNYKLELACDLKRSEIHSLGIQMVTGEIRENCQQWLTQKKLTPALPPHIFITPDQITLPRATLFLEEHLEQKLKEMDHSWAEMAQLRLADELDRIESYYKPLLANAEEQTKEEIEAEFENRRQEIDWQYRPRIRITAINCGLFHLQAANPLV